MNEFSLIIFKIMRIRHKNRERPLKQEGGLL